MYVRHVFHSEKELATHFGQRFYERWRKLLHVYHERKKTVGVRRALRITSVALAFIGAVESGEASVVYSFDDVLHGHGDQFIVDSEPLVAFEDDPIIEPLMWDMACLMLDEHPEFVDTAQYAFDIAGKHAWQAFNVICESKTKSPEEPSATVVENKKDVTEISELLATHLRYMEQNVNKPQERRSQIRQMVIEELFLEGSYVPKKVREEILHFDDEHNVRIDAIRDVLGNVSSVTFVENKGKYILSQTNNK